MIAVDEAALVCDLAETYHIMDYKALPARQAALFACGLGPDSRIMRRMGGVPATMTELLLARICDGINVLCWQNTPNGRDGVDPPASIFQAIMAAGEEKAPGPGFDSPEDFEEWRDAMLRGN